MDAPYLVRYGDPALPERMRFDDLDDAKAFAAEKRGRVLLARDWSLIADFESA